MMNFKEADEFKRDFKRISKKYRSLPEDFARFKMLISIAPLGINKHFAVLYKDKKLEIVKARLSCRVLKKFLLRIIYAYHNKTNEIEFIGFIELYSKNEQARESKHRIWQYLKKHC